MRINTSIPDPSTPGFYIDGASLNLSVLPEIGEEILEGSDSVRRVVKRIYQVGVENLPFEVMLVLSDPYPLHGWPGGPG